jgi:hypothetical protein
MLERNISVWAAPETEFSDMAITRRTIPNNHMSMTAQCPRIQRRH